MKMKNLALWFVLLSTSAMNSRAAFSRITVGRKQPPEGNHHWFCATSKSRRRTRRFSSKTNEIIRQDKYRELMDATTLSLAPMMEYTDRHFRHLVRLISKRTLLYTEMVAANALVHERKDQIEAYMDRNPDSTFQEARANYDGSYLGRFLAQGRVEPLEGASVLQLGGSDPKQMYEAAQTILDFIDRGLCDYTAINLNCGCPSPKVAGKGCFGAALMDDPQLVADLTAALHEGCEGRLPITVKCRIGTDSKQAFRSSDYASIDEAEEYANLCRFIETVASNGIVTDFSVHARIAVLQRSFSPADNRKVPPLKYHYIRRLVSDYPHCTFSLNGGIESLDQAKQELAESPGLKGIMIGRSWAADPWGFAMTDRLLYGEDCGPPHRLAVLEAFGKHADDEEIRNDPVKIRRFIIKAVTPLFAGEANSKRYRIALDEIARQPKQLHLNGKDVGKDQPPLSEQILNAAMTHLSEETLYRSPEESYDRLVYERSKEESGRSTAIVEWQNTRKAAQ